MQGVIAAVDRGEIELIHALGEVSDVIAGSLLPVVLTGARALDGVFLAVGRSGICDAVIDEDVGPKSASQSVAAKSANDAISAVAAVNGVSVSCEGRVKGIAIRDDLRPVALLLVAIENVSPIAAIDWSLPEPP